MTAGETCAQDLDLVSRDDSVWVAAERMHQRAVGTLVVCDGANQPIGILTDRDLVERVLALGRNPNQTVVEDVMTRDPTTVHAEESIETAVSLMRSGPFRRLPVVGDGGELVGMLSLDDVIVLLSEDLRQVSGLLDRQTPRAAAEG